MSEWRCIRNNPQTGISTWVKAEADGMLVQERQDISVLLDQNKAQRNIASSGWAGDYHSIAQLPASMFYDPNSGINQAIENDDDAYVRRFLNDSDNANLRTKEGRV